MKNKPLRVIWHNMKSRCLNPKHDRFDKYGGKGIVVCDEWLEFDCFENWAILNGYKEGLSIERCNLEGNYEPLNCKWIPKIDQYLNRSDSHFESLYGENKTLKEWSQDTRCKVSFVALRMRLYRGWNFEQALTTPKRSWT